MVLWDTITFLIIINLISQYQSCLLHDAGVSQFLTMLPSPSILIQYVFEVGYQLTLMCASFDSDVTHLNLNCKANFNLSN